MHGKLTKRAIDSFAYDGGWDVRWDGVLPGFGVRIYPSGKKAYVLSYRHGNRKRLLTIGQTEKLTLDHAREKALSCLARLADKVDPLEERRRKNSDRTVKGAFGEFLERYAKIRNRSWKETQRIFEKDVLPTLGKSFVQDITRQEIVSLLDELVDRDAGIMANRTLAALRRFFGWCVERGFIETSPVGNITKPAPEVTRDRVLTEAEIAEIWRACDQEGYPFGDLVKFLLISAQRRDEVATMRWPDIDDIARVWILPREATKSDRQHVVPLSAAALEILRTVPRLGEYVFTTRGDVPFSGFSAARRRMDRIISIARKAQGATGDMPQWRLHDLRRTAASGMAALGVAPHVVERILNHRSGIISGVAAVYNRYDYRREITEALEAWGRKLRQTTPEA